MGHKYVKEEDTFNISQNGTVPKPSAQEVSDNKFLRADGSWQNGGGGGSTVSADQVVLSGTEIGGVTVDGVRTPFYVPKHTFSQTEQVVGTWIDGKPIYELTKTFSEITINYQTWKDMPAFDSICSTIAGVINAWGYNANYKQNRPIEVSCAFDGTTHLTVLGMRYGNDYIGAATIQYTKSTD